MFLGTNWSTATSAIGASGAVCGIVAIFAIIYPKQSVYFLFIPVAIPIRKFIKYFAGISAVIVLAKMTTNYRDFIAHSAHLGGLIGGWFFYKYLVNLKIKLKSKPEKNRQKFHDLNRSQQGVVTEDIDAILDKVSEKGFESLTPDENRILEDARNKLRR